jgi:hypothetical protein
VAAGTGLSVGAAAKYVDGNIVFILTGGYHKGLAYHKSVFTLGKILGQFLAVYADFAASVPDVHAGDSGFSSAGSDSKILYHNLFNLFTDQ